MWRQYNGFSAVASLGQRVPQDPLGDGVHSSRRLVEEYQFSVADQRQTDAQLAPIPTATNTHNISICLLVGVANVQEQVAI